MNLLNIFNNPKIKFGELIVWDERVGKYIISDFTDYKGGAISDYLKLNPNLYSIHQVSCRQQTFPVFSFTEFNIDTGSVKTMAANLLSNLREKPSADWIQRINQKIDKYIQSEIKTIIEEFSSFGDGNEPSINFSLSLASIHILLSQKIEQTAAELN
ncbi:MAG: hypothetical protein F6K40_38760 [Okeania sp. SIO3I5]|uniref:hypothetical protein n=1 Tax=Okeania sp. SIO3I5 TaxID=2607805 RepID=UPI0013BE2267|nr:hypothetical protein [Okeania sp. SIO3I5]NEQ41805.1 hypothetical protein [Okeania sp. SIO3I5]